MGSHQTFNEGKVRSYLLSEAKDPDHCATSTSAHPLLARWLFWLKAAAGRLSSLDIINILVDSFITVERRAMRWEGKLLRVTRPLHSIGRLCSKMGTYHCRSAVSCSRRWWPARSRMGLSPGRSSTRSTSSTSTVPTCVFIADCWRFLMTNPCLTRKSQSLLAFRNRPQRYEWPGFATLHCFTSASMSHHGQSWEPTRSGWPCYAMIYSGFGTLSVLPRSFRHHVIILVHGKMCSATIEHTGKDFFNEQCDLKFCMQKIVFCSYAYTEMLLDSWQRRDRCHIDRSYTNKPLRKTIRSSDACSVARDSRVMEEKVLISVEPMALWHQSDDFMMERLAHHACGSITLSPNSNNTCDALRTADIFFKDNVNMWHLRQARVLLPMSDSIENMMDLCPPCKHKDLKTRVNDHVRMTIFVAVFMKIWFRHVLIIKITQNEIFFKNSMGTSRPTLWVGRWPNTWRCRFGSSWPRGVETAALSPCGFSSVEFPCWRYLRKLDGSRSHATALWRLVQRTAGSWSPTLRRADSSSRPFSRTCGGACILRSQALRGFPVVPWRHRWASWHWDALCGVTWFGDWPAVGWYRQTRVVPILDECHSQWIRPWNAWGSTLLHVVRSEGQSGSGHATTGQDWAPPHSVCGGSLGILVTLASREAPDHGRPQAPGV